MEVVIEFDNMLRFDPYVQFDMVCLSLFYFFCVAGRTFRTFLSVIAWVSQCQSETGTRLRIFERQGHG